MKFSKITIILRGYSLQEVDSVAQVLLTSKHIKNIEVTLNSPNALEIIAALNTKYRDQLNIGAGTVLSLEDLQAAIKAGARFVLSPVTMSKEMIDYCLEHDVIAIPGAYSPSEIYQQHQLGAQIIKVFPANELSKTYAKKVIEPLGHINLMAVGGVNESNLLEHFAGGYSHIGSAGGIFNKSYILKQDIQAMSQSLAVFDNLLENLIDVNE